MYQNNVVDTLKHLDGLCPTCSWRQNQEENGIHVPSAFNTLLPLDRL